MERQNSFKDIYNKKTLEFEDPEKILFPNLCLICGQPTDTKFSKTIHGRFTTKKSYRNNYLFSLPICISCQGKIEINTGLASKYGIIFINSIIISMIFAGIIIFLFTSYIMGLAGAILIISISVILYIKKTRDKIKLEDFIEIKIEEDIKDKIILTFKNTGYYASIEKLNQ